MYEILISLEISSSLINISIIDSSRETLNKQKYFYLVFKILKRRNKKDVDFSFS